MDTKNKLGTITFSTPSAFALWKHEILGQLSDGMWENSRPWEHWKLWHALEPVYVPNGRNEVVLNESERWRGGEYSTQKTSYNIAGLRKYIEDRMLKIGRWGAAGNVIDAADYMPNSLDEWRACKSSGKWQYDFVKDHMQEVTDKMAVAYYAASYTIKDLKRDIAIIKEAMKSLKRGK